MLSLSATSKCIARRAINALTMQPPHDHAPVSVAVVTTGLVTAVATFFLAPSAAFFDSGELAATAIELGVPHPTGFPIFNLAGHVASLLPLGSVGLRVNLLGGLAASAAVILLLQAVGCRSRWGQFVEITMCFGLALLCIGAPSVARHIRAAEIYPLVWLHAAASVILWLRTSGHRRLVGFVLLLGLGMGIHAECGLVAGSFGLAALVQALRRHGLMRPSALLSSVIFSLCAVLAIAYLPLAAGRPAAFSWGDVQDLPALVSHLTAASIRHAYRDDIGTGIEAALRLLGSGLWRDVGPILCASAVGIAVSWRTASSRLLAVGSLVLIDVLYSAAINPMGLRDEQCGIIAALGLLALAGKGVAAVGDVLAGQRRWIAVTVALSFVLIGGFRGGATVMARPGAELTGATRLVDKVVRDLPPGAVAVVSSDHLASLCAYAQVAEGSRPDALCLPVVFTRDTRMLNVLARSGHPGFAEARQLLLDANDRGAMANAMRAWVQPPLRAGTLHWELGSAAEDAQVSAHWLAGFPLGQITNKRPTSARFQAHLQGAMSQAKRWCQTADDGCPAGGDAASYVGRWASVVAATLLRSGQRGAQPLLDMALQYAPSDRSALNNYAVVLTGSGRPALALQICRKVIELHPDYTLIHRTATRAALAAGDIDAAIEHARAFLQTPRGARLRQRWLQGLIDSSSGDARRRLTALIVTGP